MSLTLACITIASVCINLKPSYGTSGMNSLFHSCACDFNFDFISGKSTISPRPSGNSTEADSQVE